MLTEFEIPEITPIPLHCDNMVAIYIAKNPVFHECTKHIELDCHFVLEKLQGGLITLSRIPNKQQPVDVFTKVLNGSDHNDVVFKLGMTDHPPT